MSSPESDGRINISDLTCWYQPIYKLSSNDVLGYEALVRNKNRNGVSPFEIFRQAEAQGEHVILDCQIIIKAQQQFQNNMMSPLFLNVFPSTLLDRSFITWWDRYSGIVPSLALEISDCEPISDWRELRAVIDSLRMRGVKIAIDDMGEGYSFLKHWIELEPDYVKLNRYYITDLAGSSMKQRVLKYLVKIIDDPEKLIIVGVEDIETLGIAKELGIMIAQGYALGMPAPLDRYTISI
jgi:EAL domain-containing protein (putative c-di-GMP-specific phosphodiesterase class I)